MSKSDSLKQTKLNDSFKNSEFQRTILLKNRILAKFELKWLLDLDLTFFFPKQNTYECEIEELEQIKKWKAKTRRKTAFLHCEFWMSISSQKRRFAFAERWALNGGTCTAISGCSRRLYYRCIYSVFSHEFIWIHSSLNVQGELESDTWNGIGFSKRKAKGSDLRQSISFLLYHFFLQFLINVSKIK